MEKNKNELITRTAHVPATVRLRESSGGEGESRAITGYAILFNSPSDPLWEDEESEAREVIAPEAVTREFLDGQDIKMNLFHDRHLILARSNKGAGTLSYSVDERGVSFEFEAPRTADGEKALELVRRGDISGCSFAYSTRYYNRDFVERSVRVEGGKSLIEYRVKAITGIYDFALVADPAYPDTSVETRELVAGLRDKKGQPGQEEENRKKRLEMLREMRRVSSEKIVR